MKNLLVTSLLSTLFLISSCQSTTNTKPDTAFENSFAYNTKTSKHYTSACLNQVNQSSQQIKLGYGSGLTLNEAKQHAYKDIAEQLGVKVNTRSKTLVIKRQSDVTQNYQNQIETFSQAEFDDLSIECLDKQDPSGTIHLLLGYDLRPLYTQIADKLITALGSTPGIVKLTGPDFLTRSKLAQDVRKSLLAKNGSGVFNAEIKLKRHKDKWQWIIAEQPFFLENNGLHLAIDWQTINKGSSQISAISTRGKTLPPLVKTETEFRLKTTTKKNGYLHLLAIYENGEIEVIRNDIKTRAFQQHITPEIPGVFEAGLLESDKAATDAYLAIITDNTLTKSTLLSPDGLSKNNSFYLSEFLSSVQNKTTAVNINLLTITPK